MGKVYMWYVCKISVYRKEVCVGCGCVQRPEEDIGCPAISLPYSFKTETLTDPEARLATTSPMSTCT